jgi:hypothetical protein
MSRMPAAVSAEIPYTISYSDVYHRQKLYTFMAAVRISTETKAAVEGVATIRIQGASGSNLVSETGNPD